MNNSKDLTKSSAPGILLFDGVCNLCNGFVQFIIKRDSSARIQFASLQSETAKSLLRKYQLPTDHLHSVVFIHEGKVYTQSDAALKVFKSLSLPWSTLYSFIVIPKGFRDLVYDWIASNRYRWFGQQETCMIPDEKLSQRFLD